ncbi:MULTISPECIES: capsule biosynthesis protein [unclassified Neisseria]|uniref:capsule biosynthesis protein n=1 Tax=unclassified Neisseria TaxID=2623750 RepID=UPI0026663C36|nr:MULTISPECIES: capsule biosynthesis protein [unclassified Neisseria]MDO1509869.1 capsule biosynthesis protein [Neisseria sp. MVDL19-042950]MDO1516067.1 capsule biosynthesis protein [Neisseria sp. MVDL18-041461]MDO1563182.1 capsule biosynthesis protein [Neisseria sp. MVDL20-010259]
MENVNTQSYLEELISTSNRVLLLQGPIGTFFHDFSNWLSTQQSKTVFKINFNYGDELFYPSSTPNTFAYRDTYQAFPDFLSDFIEKNDIQAVVCFGDTRPYHIVAKQIAGQKNRSFWAFEEGYFRPFYVTLEKDGVNDFSSLPRNADFFLKALPSLRTQQYQEPPAVPGGFLPMAKHAVRYYFAARRHHDKYPYYIHHRVSNLGHYIKSWAFSGLKRANYVLEDRKFARRVTNGKFGKFFILPLQVMNDSQVRVHSDFSSVRSFLLHILTSFATHAPDDVNLIVKHHPMDRGFIDYRKDINHFIKQHPKLKGRVFYVHDAPLPVLLRHGAGMVTLNSTCGLSALIHNMPVKVIGRASYDIAGITFQDSLAEFWNRPTPPDSKLFHAFRMYHINVTQINGSFYSKVNLPTRSYTYQHVRQDEPLVQKSNRFKAV